MHEVLSQIEEMSPQEIEKAMQEIDFEERCRAARELVESGICCFCRRQTLRVVFTGARFRISCPCNFTTPSV